MFNFVSLMGAFATAFSPPVTAQSGATPVALMSPSEARRVIIGCGLPDQRVSVSYEQDMQEDVVWIAADKASLPESTLACLAHASLKTIYYVYFRDEAEQKRYWSVYSKVGNEVEVAESKVWLRGRNLLGAMPLPKKGMLLADYAKAVEVFCGIRPGSLLVARNNEMITFAEGGLGRITSNGIEGAAATTEQFECVMKVTAAADLQSHGIFFGFIGNAAPNVR
ncbi:hypothetical protein O4H52_14125 [Sphingomonadaceae bacterium G21617-S1]|nr:hypothetical protein [Sphingomonadaceae bacterium G21617-S1]